MKTTQPNISPEVKAMERIEQSADNAAFLRDAIWISQILEQAQKRRFHGKLIFVMEKGLTMRYIKEESHMPPHREGG